MPDTPHSFAGITRHVRKAEAEAVQAAEAVRRHLLR